MFTIKIRPQRFSIILLFLALCFLVASMGVGYTYSTWPGNMQGWYYHFYELFSSDVETSFPTFFSVILLIITWTILLTITYIKSQSQELTFVRYWFILSLVFMYLSVDESIQIHERFIEPLRELANLDGTQFNFSTWLICAIPLVSIFVLVFARFLWHLPRKIAILMIASGIIFVSGAVMLEIVHDLSLTKGVLSTWTPYIEEFLEMSGIILFIYTLLSYLATLTPKLEIIITTQNETETQLE